MEFVGVPGGTPPPLMGGGAAPVDGFWLNSAIMESFDMVCFCGAWFSPLLLLVDIELKSSKKLFWFEVALVLAFVEEFVLGVPFWFVIVEGPTKSLNSLPPDESVKENAKKTC